MELIMEIILGIVSIILGTALFWMLNSMFSITYFGFGAMVSLWIGCFVVSLLIIGGIGKLLLGVYKVDNNNWNNISNSRICCK